MSGPPHITLEQWRTLIAVVDSGGYAQAAERLHKSQSTLTYAVQKLESLLGVKAFEIRGRRAHLTPVGKMLYRRARVLLEEAQDLERAAGRLSAGWEAQIHVAAEVLFPTWLLFDCLDHFANESPRTRVEVLESVLGGTSEALLAGEVDLAISPRIPSGFLGDPLMQIRAMAVARADHPLHRLGRELTRRDLGEHRHVVVRDSGMKRSEGSLSVDVERRWTVTNMATSIEAVRRGHGFAWLPEPQIRDDLAAGVLKPLPLREGRVTVAQLYLILAAPDAAGPGVRRLAEIIRETVTGESLGRPGRRL